MTKQNFTNGQKVFTYSQGLFGGSKIGGTVKNCEKYSWVILEDSQRWGQKKVRLDKCFWYTEESLAEETELIKKENIALAKAQQKEEEELNKLTEEIKQNYQLTTPGIGKTVTVIGFRGYVFNYVVTSINEHGIWGKEIEKMNFGEIKIGSLNSEFYVPVESVENGVNKSELVMESGIDSGVTTKIKSIKAKELLTGIFTNLYSIEGYQWKILSVINTSKTFVTVEVIDEMGYGFKTGSIVKGIKKKTIIMAS